MPRSKEHQEARKDNSLRRKARLEAELKANLRKRKDQARGRADVKPDPTDLAVPALDKDDV